MSGSRKRMVTAKNLARRVPVDAIFQPPSAFRCTFRIGDITGQGAMPLGGRASFWHGALHGCSACMNHRLELMPWPTTGRVRAQSQVPIAICVLVRIGAAMAVQLSCARGPDGSCGICARVQAASSSSRKRRAHGSPESCLLLSRPCGAACRSPAVTPAALTSLLRVPAPGISCRRCC